MVISISLDQQINRLGFLSAIVVIVTAVISAFIPLDAPGGYNSEHADRVAWAGEIAPADIESSFLGASLLLLVVVIAMAFQFKGAMDSEKK